MKATITLLLTVFASIAIYAQCSRDDLICSDLAQTIMMNGCPTPTNNIENLVLSTAFYQGNLYLVSEGSIFGGPNGREDIAFAWPCDITDPTSGCLNDGGNQCLASFVCLTNNCGSNNTDFFPEIYNGLSNFVTFWECGDEAANCPALVDNYISYVPPPPFPVLECEDLTITVGGIRTDPCKSDEFLGYEINGNVISVEIFVSDIVFPGGGGGNCFLPDTWEQSFTIPAIEIQEGLYTVELVIDNDVDVTEFIQVSPCQVGPISDNNFINFPSNPVECENLEVTIGGVFRNSCISNMGTSYEVVNGVITVSLNAFAITPGGNPCTNNTPTPWSDVIVIDESDLTDRFYTVRLEINDELFETDFVDVSACVDPCENYSINPVVSDESCSGDDGRIIILTEGSQSPISYNWAGGLPSVSTQSSLTPGTYFVTVTDANDCVSSLSVDVVAASCSLFNGPVCGSDGTTYPDACAAECAGVSWNLGACVDPCADLGVSLVIEQETCEEDDGRIIILANGGNGNYSYNWSGGLPSSSSQANLSPGTYFVTVEDGNDCFIDTSIVILPIFCSDFNGPVCGSDGNTYPDACAAECAGVSWSLGACVDPCADLGVSLVIEQETCEEDDGRIIILTNGGNGNYSYNWSGGLPSSSSQANLSPGTYFVTVEDGNDCFIDTSIVILPIFCSDFNGPVCGSDGNTYPDACAAECAGVSWNLGACVDPCADLGLSLIIEQETCEEDDGRIIILANGGNGSYSYNWSGGLPSSSSQANLSPGTYFVTVEDGNDCFIDTSIVILPIFCSDFNGPVCGSDGNTYPDACAAECAGVSWSLGACVDPCENFVILPLVIQDTCGTDDGRIVILTQGGAGNVSFDWNRGLSPTSTNDGLSSGVYVVTVIDDNDCQIDTTIVIPPLPCEAIIGPVCGFDGEEYPNACAAECAGVDYVPGSCTDQCICPLVYDPVCVSGITFPNACAAECAGYTDYNEGECEAPCFCPLDFNPVCDAEGNEYSNACAAACAGVEVVDCTDEGGVFCPSLYDPVCGDNGFTYPNPCSVPDGVGYVFGECEVEPECVCTQEYSPVCGNDGNTYSNECKARCAGITEFSPGLCNEPCTCTNDYNPVCGTDGRTYTNACRAECAGVDYTEGSCLQECNCPTLVDPVCGTDGVTYANSCLAECAGVDWTPGICDQICDCPTVYDPVCADGITYQNICYAECAGVAWERCDYDEPCFCPTDYSPVCGADGNTYSNACQAACANVEVISQGRCLGDTEDLICTDWMQDIINEFPVCGQNEFGEICQQTISSATYEGRTVIVVLQSCFFEFNSSRTETVYDLEGNKLDECFNVVLAIQCDVTLAGGLILADLDNQQQLWSCSDGLPDCYCTLDFSASVESATCSGGRGSVRITPFAGTPPYTIRLGDNSNENGLFSDLLPGTYPVLVRDAVGCTKQSYVTIRSGNIIVTPIIIEAPECGSRNGQIRINVTGGEPPYSFQFGNGPIRESSFFGGIEARTYNLRVFDATGCETEINFTVECENDEGDGCPGDLGDLTCLSWVQNLLVELADKPCFDNGNDSYAGVSLDVGNYQGNRVFIVREASANSPFSQSSNTAIYDCTGVKIEECWTSGTALGCVVGDGSIADQVLSLTTLWVCGTNTPNCGSINIGITPGQPDECLQTVVEVFGQFSAGCTTLGSIESELIGNTLRIDVNTLTATPPCPEVGDTWSTLFNAGQLQAGSYTIEVYQDGRLLEDRSFTVRPCTPCSIDLIVERTSPSCGEPNGRLRLIGTGGQAPYAYDFGSGFQSSDNLSNLPSGTYDLRIRDINGCVAVRNDVELIDNLTAPSPFFSTLTEGLSVRFRNESAGGAATYRWTFGDGQSTRTDNPVHTYVVAGTYTVCLAATNDCDVVTNCREIEVGEDCNLSLNAEIINTSCGQSNGRIIPIVFGGVAPLSYSWLTANGQLVSNAFESGDLPPGSYTLIVSDANQCEAALTGLDVNATTELDVNLVATPETCSGRNGTISAEVTGGTAPYSLSWSTNQNRQSLAAGNYRLTVTDAAGCRTARSVVVEGEGSNVDIDSQFSSPDCNANNGSISVSASAGEAPYTFRWSDGRNGATRTNLAAGVYRVTATDAVGCIAFREIQLDAADGPQVAAFLIPDRCENDNGAIGLDINGGSPPYSIRWSDGAGTDENERTGLVAGSYRTTVTDANGCRAIIRSEVEAQGVPIGTPAFSYSIDQRRVNFQNNTNTTATIDTWQWSFGDGTESSLENPMKTYSADGRYEVCLTVSNDCGPQTSCSFINIGEFVPWEVISTPGDDNHTIVFPSGLETDLAGVAITVGDFIGVFYESQGEELCGGFARWTGGDVTVVAPVNDPDVTRKNGFEDGERFSWKVWRTAASEELEVAATYVPVGSNIVSGLPADAEALFSVDALSGITRLETSACQTLTLRPGFNLISSWVIPDQPTIMSIIEENRESVVLVKDDLGRVIYPDLDLDGIGAWEWREGYRIKATEEFSFQICGTRAGDAGGTIPIEEGVHWIGYPRSRETPPNQHMSTVRNCIRWMKDDISGTYLPALSSPFGTMEFMIPGKGYKVRGTCSAELPVSGIVQNDPPSVSNKNLRYFTEPANTGSEATIIINKSALPEEVDHGDEIAVVGENGIVVGAVEFAGNHLAITIWGDASDTDERTEGLLSNEAFFIRHWSQSTGTVQDFALELRNEQATTYSEDVLYIVSNMSAMTTTGTNSNQILSQSWSIYPNPVVDELRVFVARPQVQGPLEIAMFDARGRLLLTRTTASSSSEVILNTTSLQAGVYFLRLQSDVGSSTKRFLVR